MPRSNLLFTLLLTITLYLHTVKVHLWMLWLTTIMQKPAVARRTIAVELLRRLDQVEARRRHPSSPPASHRPRFPDSMHGSGKCTSTPIHPEGHWSSSPGKSRFWLLKQQSCRGTPPDPVISPRIPEEPHDSGFAMPEIRIPVLTPSSPSSVAKIPEVLRQDCVPTIEPGATQQTMVVEELPIQGAPQFHDDDESDCASFSDSESSIFDATVCRSSTPLFGRRAHDPREDAIAGAKDEDFNSADRTLVSTSEELYINLNELDLVKHRRDFSIDCPPITRRKTSTVLQTRRRTNGGLLEFRSSAMVPNEPKPTRINRRNVSVSLPIRHITSQPGGTHRIRPQSCISSAPLPAFGSGQTRTTAPTEAELQYKHRHIFVGTASLHSFLENLESSTPGSTSKRAVMRAFTILASHEQVMARRRSVDPADWNLVTRITPNMTEFNYITLARVQLGFVSLQHFIDSIPFNTHDEAPTAVVAEAFKNASHMDADESRKAGSKARAFRAWVLSERDAVE